MLIHCKRNMLLPTGLASAIVLLIARSEYVEPSIPFVSLGYDDDRSSDNRIHVVVIVPPTILIEYKAPCLIRIEWSLWVKRRIDRMERM